MANQPDHWGLSATDSVLPATPMFHANCWGVPYVCAMMGIKMIFPGPHLAPRRICSTCSPRNARPYALGVPTIWLGMLQLLDAEPERYRLPPGIRMLVGGAPAPESLIRAYARHGAAICHGWGMTEMSPLGTISFIKPELQGAGEDERFARYAHGRRPGADHGHPHRRRGRRELPWDGKAVGEIQVRGPFIAGGYHETAPDPEQASPPTAGFAPATSRRSTRTATCGSPIASRTSSSRAASGSARSTWRTC